MSQLQIIKRNGKPVDFDKKKIEQALINAFSETEQGIDYDLIADIAESIEEDIQEAELIPTVESVQDMVESYLMESDRKDVARQYITYRDQRSKLRAKGWEMTDLQRDIYEQKYRFQNETFAEFLERVSGGDSAIKKLISDKKFLPAGRILAGRGLNSQSKKVTYSNCFVTTEPQDNIESIFQVASDMARTYSFGGGCGTTLKNLRPNGSTVRNSAKNTTGAVSFMDLYSTVTGLISQKGRRGALILTLPVSHPDIEEFIDVKNDLNRVTKANISVGITDDFMEAAKADVDWTMKFVVEYQDDENIEYTKTVKARYLFRKIAESCWRTAEPGVLFWDNVNNYHINDHLQGYEYTATNP